MYLESVNEYMIRKNPMWRKTQVALGPWVIIGNIFNADWDEREGGNQSPLKPQAQTKLWPKPSLAWIREVELEPGLEQPLQGMGT